MLMAPLLWGKVVLLLVAVVAVLQVVHLVLLSRLESQRHLHHQQPLEVVPGTDAQMEPSFSALAASLRGRGRVLDASGEYRLVPHLTGRVKRPTADTTLVTHCDRHHLRLLPTLVQRWEGPMSVAVFADEQELPAVLWAVAALRACHSAVALNVSFHLVLPLSSVVSPLHAVPTGVDPCTVTVSGTERPNYAGVISYPNNLLRNVARRGAQTDFVLVVDVDMVPSEGLRKDFNEFVSRGGLRRDDKTVYVVPAFEAADTVTPPADKSALLHLVDHGQLRPFYVQLCFKCQVHTDYEAWQKEPPSKGLSPLFEVLWKDPWEPFYISRNSVPFYDERFKQYGFNRISQVCELHVAGYKFSVLNNAFLVHLGLKTPDSFHMGKDLEQERNRMLFRQFKVELRDKYPESSRRCY